MAAPGSEGTDKSADVEGPDEPRPAAVDDAAPSETPAAAPRKRGGFLSKLLTTTALLAIVAGAAGYAALTFRDADPRIGVAAGYVDQGLAEAQHALDVGKATFDSLTGSDAPAVSSKVTTRRSQPLSQAPEPAPTPAAEKAPEPPAASVEPAKEAAAEAPAPQAQTDIPEPPRKPTELTQEPEAAPPPPAPPPPAPEPPPAAVVESAKPAEPVIAPPQPPVAAAQTEQAGPDGFTDRDLIWALEGRLDAMSDEIKALRDKLDAPKSEARAAPDTEAPRTPAPAASPADAGAASVVLAFALQRELEAGRPFADEIAALSRLGAEPAPAPILIDASEKGLPTGAQLKESFAAVAKRLKAEEAHAQPHAESGDIAGHLLEGASKLVKVRPAGQAHSDTLEGKIDAIEADLARNDFAGAEAVFAALPESAREQAKEFGDALRQRAEAAKAADELLRGAIAALAAKK